MATPRNERVLSGNVMTNAVLKENTVSQGSCEIKWFFVRLSSQENDGRSGRSVNERVISFQAADIGRHMALHVSFNRIHCDVVQRLYNLYSWEDATILILPVGFSE